LRNIFRKTGVTSRRQLRDLPLAGTFGATDSHSPVETSITDANGAGRW
jgi:hypothetical protein